MRLTSSRPGSAQKPVCLAPTGAPVFGVYPGLIRLSSGHFFLLSDLEQSLIKKPEKHVWSTPVDPSCGVYEWRSSRLILIPFYVSIP